MVGNQEIIKDQLQFERNIRTERAHRSEKTMIDGALNKRRAVIPKFLNFRTNRKFYLSTRHENYGPKVHL